MTSTPNTIRAELHSHSTYSDGAFSPEEVARRCAEAGVRLWSLTDHDTVNGCERASEAAAAHGIDFIPGIEVSAYQGRSVHVLGYGVDTASAKLRRFSAERLDARESRMRRMVARLDELGAPVEWEEVVRIVGDGAMARPHLAQALVEAGHVESRNEAFDRFLAEDGPAYVATTWPTVPEAIELIHQAGGVAVLAHPGIYDLDEAIDAWAAAGLDGVEVGHPKHGPQEAARYGAIAARLGLLTTASNDFHGPEKIGSDGFGLLELPAPLVHELCAAIEARSA